MFTCNRARKQLNEQKIQGSHARGDQASMKQSHRFLILPVLLANVVMLTCSFFLCVRGGGEEGGKSDGTRNSCTAGRVQKLLLRDLRK